jgi:hypothetical protein
MLFFQAIFSGAAICDTPRVWRAYACRHTARVDNRGFRLCLWHTARVDNRGLRFAHPRLISSAPSGRRRLRRDAARLILGRAYNCRLPIASKFLENPRLRASKNCPMHFFEKII